MAKLNPVTEYLKNVAKSVKYATVAYIDTNAPATKEFRDTNKELFQDITAGIRNYKGSILQAESAVKNTALYRQGMAAFENTMTAIKTGKFYNKDAEDAAMDAMFNTDEEYQDESQGGGGESGFEYSENGPDGPDARQSPTISKGEKSLMKIIHRTSSTQGKRIAGTVEASARYLGTTSRANASAIVAQGQQMTSLMQGGFRDIHGGLNELNQFNQSVVKTLAENATQYFQITTGIMQENNAILKEMLEMQRNLYQAQNQDNNDFGGKLYNMVGAEGTPDLKEYGKNVLGNIKKLINEKSFGMGDMLNEDMLRMFAANPTAAIPGFLISTALGPAVKTSLQQLNSTLSGVFTTAIARLNYNAKKHDGENNLAEILGKIFGVQDIDKNRIDTRSTANHAVPFDFETRKAIIEIIPSQLSRIEAAITGKEAKVYDMKMGRWMDMSEVKENFENLRKGSISNATYQEQNEIAQMLDEIHTDRQTMIKIQEAIEKINSKRFDDYGYYDRSGSMADRANRYGVDDEQIMAIVDRMMQNLSKQTKMQSALNFTNAKTGYNNYLKQIEKEGTSSYNLLFNGFDNRNALVTDRYDISDKTAKLASAFDLTKQKDQYGLTLYDYLRDIRENTWWGGNGGSGNGSGGNGGPSSPQGPITPRPTHYNDRRIMTEEDMNVARNLQADYAWDRSQSEIIREAAARGENIPYVRNNERVSEEDMSRIMNNIDTRAQFMKSMQKIGQMEDNTTFLNRAIQDAAEKSRASDAVMGEKGPEAAATKSFAKKLVDAATIGQKFGVIAEGIQNLTMKPADLLTGVLTKADESIYGFFFNDTDATSPVVNGEKVKGFAGRMNYELSNLFKKTNNWIDTVILGKDKEGNTHFKERLKEYTGIDIDKIKNDYLIPIKTGISNSIKGAIQTVKDSFKTSYGYAKDAYYNITGKPRPEPEPETAAESVGEAASAAAANAKEKFKENIADIEQHADGARNVTKTGLTIISKGERIIPSDENIYNPDLKNASRDKDRRNEEKIKQRLNQIFDQSLNIEKHADGTKSYGSTEAQVQQAAIANRPETAEPGLAKQFMQQLFGDEQTLQGKITYANAVVKKHLPDAAGGAVVGGVAGTLLGGPLIGAVLGSAVNIVSNSEFLQKQLFGEKVVMADGSTRRKGGLFSQETQEMMKKYLPDMKALGITGTILGAVTGLGPIAGLAIGSAIGFAKNNEGIQKALFGEHGMFNDKTKKMIKKAFPNMAIGAGIGALGVGAGIVGTGGLGLLPFAVLGAGAGLVSSTDEFKDFLLGKKDEKGNRKGGLAGALKETMVQPLASFANGLKDQFGDWLKDKMFKPVERAMAPIGKTIELGFKDTMTFIGNSLKKMFDPVTGIPIFAQIGWMVKKAFGPLETMGKKAVKAAGWILSRPSAWIGKMGDKMRRSHIQSGNADYMTAQERLKFMGTDDYAHKDVDKKMAGSTVEELENMKEQFELFRKGRGYFDEKTNDTIRDMGSTVTEKVGGDTGRASQIMKAVNAGETEEAQRLIDEARNISVSQKRDLYKYVNEKGDELRRLKQKKANYDEDRASILKNLDEMGFKGVTEDNIDKYGSALDTEISSRKKLIGENAVTDAKLQGNTDMANAAIITGSINDNFAELIPLMAQSTQYLAEIAAKGGYLTDNEDRVLKEEHRLGVNMANNFIKRDDDLSNKINKRITKGLHTNKISAANRFNLLSNEPLMNRLDNLSDKGYHMSTDINSVLEANPKTRDRYLTLAEWGYQVPDISVLSDLSPKQFNNLMTLVKAGVRITDFDAVKDLDTEDAQVMADLYSNGFRDLNQGTLAGLAKTGGRSLLAEGDIDVAKKQMKKLNIKDDATEQGVAIGNKISDDYKNQILANYNTQEQPQQPDYVDAEALNSLVDVPMYANGLSYADRDQLAIVSKGERIEKANAPREHLRPQEYHSTLKRNVVDDVYNGSKYVATKAIDTVRGKIGTGTSSTPASRGVATTLVSTDYGPLVYNKDASGKLIYNKQATPSNVIKTIEDRDTIMSGISDNLTEIAKVSAQHQGFMKWYKEKEEKKDKGGFLSKLFSVITNAPMILSFAAMIAKALGMSGLGKMLDELPKKLGGYIAKGTAKLIEKIGGLLGKTKLGGKLVDKIKKYAKDKGWSIGDDNNSDNNSSEENEIDINGPVTKAIKIHNKMVIDRLDQLIELNGGVANRKDRDRNSKSDEEDENSSSDRDSSRRDNRSESEDDDGDKKSKDSKNENDKKDDNGKKSDKTEPEKPSDQMKKEKDKNKKDEKDDKKDDKKKDDKKKQEPEKPSDTMKRRPGESKRQYRERRIAEANKKKAENEKKKQEPEKPSDTINKNNKTGRNKRSKAIEKAEELNNKNNNKDNEKKKDNKNNNNEKQDKKKNNDNKKKQEENKKEEKKKQKPEKPSDTVREHSNNTKRSRKARIANALGNAADKAADVTQKISDNEDNIADYTNDRGIRYLYLNAKNKLGLADDDDIAELGDIGFDNPLDAILAASDTFSAGKELADEFGITDKINDFRDKISNRFNRNSNNDNNEPTEQHRETNDNRDGSNNSNNNNRNQNNNDSKNTDNKNQHNQNNINQSNNNANSGRRPGESKRQYRQRRIAEANKRREEYQKAQQERSNSSKSNRIFNGNDSIYANAKDRAKNAYTHVKQSSRNLGNKARRGLGKIVGNATNLFGLYTSYNTLNNAKDYFNYNYNRDNMSPEEIAEYEAKMNEFNNEGIIGKGIDIGKNLWGAETTLATAARGAKFLGMNNKALDKIINFDNAIVPTAMKGLKKGGKFLMKHKKGAALGAALLAPLALSKAKEAWDNDNRSIFEKATDAASSLVAPVAAGGAALGGSALYNGYKGVKGLFNGENDDDDSSAIQDTIDEINERREEANKNKETTSSHNRNPEPPSKAAKEASEKAGNNLTSKLGDEARDATKNAKAMEEAQNGSAILKKGKSVINTICAKISSLIGGDKAEAFKKFFNGLFEKVSKPNTIKKIAKGIAKKAAVATGAVATGIGGIILGGIEAGLTIKRFYDGYSDAETMLDLPPGSATTGMKLFTGAFNALWEFDLNPLNIIFDTKEVLSMAITAVGKLFGITEEALKKVKETGEKAAKSMAQTAKDVASNVADTIKNTAATAWDKFKDFGSSIYDKAKDIGKTAWDKFSDYGSKLLNKAGDMAASAWNTIKDTGAWAYNKAKSGFTAAKNYIQDSRLYKAAANTWLGRKLGMGKWGRGSEIDNSNEFGFYSQKDNKFANMPFNIAGDTENQTIGDSFCGPSTAQNIGSHLGIKIPFSEAYNTGLKNKVNNDGTTDNLFNDIFEPRGYKVEKINATEAMNTPDNIPIAAMGTDKTATPENDIALGGKGNRSLFGSNPHWLGITGNEADDSESDRPQMISDEIKRNTLNNATKIVRIVPKGYNNLGKGKFGRGIQRHYTIMNKNGFRFGRAKSMNRDVVITPKMAKTILNAARAKWGRGEYGYPPGVTDEKMWALANWTGEKTNINPKFLYAQWYHESKHFQSELAQYYNFGGITGSNDAAMKQPDGDCNYMPFNGPEDFASYDAWYLNRCDGVSGNSDLRGFTDALKANGYYGDDPTRYYEACKRAMDTINFGAPDMGLIDQAAISTRDVGSPGKPGKGGSSPAASSNGGNKGSNGSSDGKKKLGGIFGELADITSILAGAFSLGGNSSNKSSSGNNSNNNGNNGSTGGPIAEASGLDMQYIESNHPGDESQTNLSNINPMVKTLVNQFAKDYYGRHNKKLLITGGAELGYHSKGIWSHGNGYKTDVDTDFNEQDKALAHQLGASVNFESDHYDIDWSGHDTRDQDHPHNAIYSSTPPATAQGKWGRGKWGRGLEGIPQEFIDNLSDYNKINDNDDLMVRHAKEANIRKLYNKQQQSKPNTAKSINSFDMSKIPEYNRISPDDDLFVQRMKKMSWRKYGYTGEGKWGKGPDIKDKFSSAINKLKEVSKSKLEGLSRKMGKGKYSKRIVINESNRFGRGNKWGRGDGTAIYQALINAGFNDVAAAGVLGNIMAESTLNPSSDNGTHHGLCQWDHEDRWPNAVKWMQANGYDPESMEGQIAFAYKEASDRGIVDEMNNASSPEEAAKIWDDKFEVSGGGTIDKRKSFAASAYNSKGADLQASGASSGGSSSSSSGGIFGKIKGIASSMAGQMQKMISPLAKAMGSLSEKVFGGDLKLLFGDSNPFATMSSGGESDSGGSNGGKPGSGAGGHSTDAGIQAASAWANSMVGQPGYGNNGCTAFARDYLLKAGNPVGQYMADGSQGNLMWVPTLVEWAKSHNMWKDASQGGAEGDVAITLDEGHATIADGDGGTWGNSSSKNQIIHYQSLAGTFDPVDGYVATGSGSSKVSTSDGSSRSREEMIADAGTSNASGKWGKGKYGRSKGNNEAGSRGLRNFFSSSDKSKVVNLKEFRKVAKTYKNKHKDMFDMTKIPDYNKITANDDLLVRKAKEDNIKKLYGNNIQSTNNNVQQAPVETKFDINNVPEYNRISKDDSNLVRQAKLDNLRKKYGYTGDGSEFGKGKWGRGLDDIPQEFLNNLSKYNKINDNDDLLIRRAKEANIRRLYNKSKQQVQTPAQSTEFDMSKIPEYNRINPDDDLFVQRMKRRSWRRYGYTGKGKWGRGIGSWFKRIGGAIGDFATNIWHGVTGIFTGNKKPKENKEENKPATDPMKKVENDIKYIMTAKEWQGKDGKNPSKEEAIQILNKTKDYPYVISKDGKKVYTENDLKYIMTDKAWQDSNGKNPSREQAIDILYNTTDTNQTQPNSEQAKEAENKKESESRDNTPQTPAQSTSNIDVPQPGKNLKKEANLSPADEWYSKNKDKVPEYNRINSDDDNLVRQMKIDSWKQYGYTGKGKWGLGEGNIKDRVDNILHPHKRFLDDHGINSIDDAKAYIKDVPQDYIDSLSDDNKIDYENDDIGVIRSKAVNIKNLYDNRDKKEDVKSPAEITEDAKKSENKPKKKKHHRGIGGWFRKIGGSIGDFATNIWKGITGMFTGNQSSDQASADDSKEKDKKKVENDIKYIMTAKEWQTNGKNPTKEEAIAILNKTKDYPYVISKDGNKIYTENDIKYIMTAKEWQDKNGNNPTREQAIDILYNTTDENKPQSNTAGKCKWGRGIGSWFKRIGGAIGDFATDIWHGIKRGGISIGGTPILGGNQKKQQPETPAESTNKGSLENDIKYIMTAKEWQDSDGKNPTREQAIAILNKDKKYNGTISSDGESQYSENDIKYIMTADGWKDSNGKNPTREEAIKILSEQGKQGQGKWGRGLNNLKIPTYEDITKDMSPIQKYYYDETNSKYKVGNIKDRVDFILHPHKRFGDDHGLKTVDDIKKYIQDVPESFISDENKIDYQNDNLTIMRAKALKIRQLYDAHLKEAGVTPEESKAKSVTIDPNKPNETNTVDKNNKETAKEIAGALASEVGPNGKTIDENDIKYIMTAKAWQDKNGNNPTREQAIEILQKDKKYAITTTAEEQKKEDQKKAEEAKKQAQLDSVKTSTSSTTNNNTTNVTNNNTTQADTETKDYDGKFDKMIELLSSIATSLAAISGVGGIPQHGASSRATNSTVYDNRNSISVEQFSKIAKSMAKLATM